MPGAEAAGLGAQAKTLRTSEQDRVDVAAGRAAWRGEAAGTDPKRFVLLDESGFDTRLTRTHARAQRGQRAHGRAPGERWQRLTLIGALAFDGLCATMTVAGVANTAVFLAFVTEALIPVLKRTRPEAIVVMNNLAAHRAAVVRRALDEAGVAYRYLPAYSPDMNPIASFRLLRQSQTKHLRVVRRA